MTRTFVLSASTVACVVLASAAQAYEIVDRYEWDPNSDSPNRTVSGRCNLRTSGDPSGFTVRYDTDEKGTTTYVIDRLPNDTCQSEGDAIDAFCRTRGG